MLISSAIFVNLSGTFLLAACSPLSHVLLGQAKTCALMLAGWMFLGQAPALNSLLGSAVAMASIIGYTLANLSEMAKEQTVKGGGIDHKDKHV